jgi:hypothetical protein
MKIRGDIHNFVRIPSVNDTGNKLSPVSFATSDKLIAGVIDTGD